MKPSGQLCRQWGHSCSSSGHLTVHQLYARVDASTRWPGIAASLPQCTAFSALLCGQQQQQCTQGCTVLTTLRWGCSRRHHYTSTVAAHASSEDVVGGAAASIGTARGPSPPAPSMPRSGAQPPGPPKPAAVRYSPLHYNILELCQRITPTEDETRYKQQIVELIRTHTKRAMQEVGRRCEVQVFGSFATGLATWSSDVDLVVTGIMEPDRHTGVYDISERGRVVGRLRRIGEALRRCKKLDNPRISIIPRARIPIIKLKTRNVAVDISISDDTGPRAARYMAQQVRQYPPMKPLVLVLKAYLRSVGLNEVMYGGLSSYSLCNMVVAHLQEEIKAGRDVYDLGESLYAFLLRYGEEFDYGHDAVSIESGGIVPKHQLGMHTDLGRGMYGSELDRYNERLSVDCPITGRDVSNGTFRIDAVRVHLQRAARHLEALARGRKVDDLSVNYLQALFDVQQVVKRTSLDSQYADDFIRLSGKGTSPEIIQIGRVTREELDMLDDDDEELLGGAGDDDQWDNAAAAPDMWATSDSDAAEDSSSNSRGPRGKGRGSRGKGR